MDMVMTFDRGSPGRATELNQSPTSSEISLDAIHSASNTARPGGGIYAVGSWVDPEFQEQETWRNAEFERYVECTGASDFAGRRSGK